MTKLKKNIIVCGLLLASSVTVCARTITPPPYTDMQGKPLSSIECAAVNLYHEDRGESNLSNAMVMAVVLNRVDDERYPNSICGVVFQDSQFSWTHDGLSDKIEDEYQYKRLYRLIEDVLINKTFVQGMSGGVTHYHATKVHPYWTSSDKMEFKFKIGNHSYYKWRK